MLAPVRCTLADEPTPATPAGEAAKSAPAEPGSQPAATAPQHAPASPKTSPAPASAGNGRTLPGEVEPAEYLLLDRNGERQHFPNFKYEDFIRLYYMQHRLSNQDTQPHFVIQQVQITGTATARQAELTAEFTIDTRDSGWVRVPLRLGRAVLLKEAEYEGSGEQLVDFESQQEGYVSWIRSEPGQVHKIRLKLLVPLTTIGGETDLKLNLPRTPLGKLDLVVPSTSIQARVSEGSELLQPETTSDGKTRLRVLLPGGDFELAWHAAEVHVANVPVVLEATGQILVSIDGRSVKTEARLAVRSIGGPFDRFRMRLPPGAEIIEKPRVGVQLVPVEDDKASQSDGSLGQLIEVRLFAKTVGPLELRLVTERPYNVAGQDEQLELSGFEVQGKEAVRQWGNIAVQVLGDWQVVWGTQRNVRQVDELPDSLRRDSNIVAGFEYYVQPQRPYRLSARVVRQQTRINVEQEYQVTVAAHQLQLLGKLKYNVRGAKLRKLEIDLPGWQIDDVGPPSWVNPEAALETDGAVCSIPLAQPAAGSFDITLRAHQPLAGGDAELSFDVPRPHADTVGQAIVAVLPADNVELSPRAESMIGLAQSLRPPIKLPERQQDPLFYRAEGPDARFVAGIKLHEQTITSDVVSTVVVDEQTVEVDEQLVFQIAYEPVDSLTLLVPQALSLDELGVKLDGQQLAVTGPRSEPATPGEDSAIRLALPGPRIGRVQLQVTYVLPQKKLTPAATTSATVPLVMPGSGKLAHNQLRLSSRAGILAKVRTGLWTADTSPSAVTVGSQFVASQPASELPLAIELKQRSPDGKTVVQCGWIQTVLAGGVRHDRVLYRFRSGDRHLRLAIPPGATSLEVTLDQKPVEIDKEERGEYVVPLTAVDGNEHHLQLSYSFPRRPLGFHLEAQPPEIRPEPTVHQLYWELILPTSDHLLTAPAEFTTEYTWERNGLVWRRELSLDQTKLEQQLGVTALPAPAAQGNRYLFSTVGLVPLDLWWAPRSVLVFGASAVLLAVGLALIYFPRLRHPATIFALGVLVLAATLVNPESAIVIAQAALVGVLLLAIAALLARRTLPPPAPAPIVSSSRGSSRAVLDRSITEAYFRPPRGPQPSTATAPAVPISPEGEP
ncbi:MAG TPA: hypothetical protein VMF30_07215 [Pirellulales bacterium]|nr:hypothetical protein [Pirellulales bacterium]